LEAAVELSTFVQYVTRKISLGRMVESADIEDLISSLASDDLQQRIRLVLSVSGVLLKI
jgi:hypothetical protein